MRTMGFSLIIASAFSLGAACLHPPRDYPGKLGSKVQEYLFFKSGQDIHMVMNQQVQSTLPLPKEFAWVTPLPALPSKYFQEKDEMFETLFRATEPVMKSRSIASLSADRFIVHDTVHVGNYEIIPIEITDVHAGAEINQWLAKNGYAEVPVAGLRYYLKPKACFLAIKVKGMSGVEKVLHPLHVVYRADEARLPLKFFANAGSFQVYVYVRNRGSAPVAQAGLKNAGILENGWLIPDKAIFDKLALNAFASDTGSIQRFFGPKLNDKDHKLSDWKEDPLLLLD